MDSIGVVDTEALVSDLRIATRYAARLGLLRDEAVFGKLQCVEQSLKCEGGASAHALTVALNDVAQLIAPMTVADLRFGRDPFLPSNQQKSWWLQLGLAVVALCVLLITGYFMHSLRTEEAGLKALKQLEAMRPQSAVTALRKMAQEDLPREKLGPDPESVPSEKQRIRGPEPKLVHGHQQGRQRRQNHAVPDAPDPHFPMGEAAGAHYLHVVNRR